MPRVLDDPDNDQVVQFDERIVDIDGDTVSVTVEYDAVNDGTGWTQQDLDSSNVSWLNFTITTNTLLSGATEVVVTVEFDSAELVRGNDYRFTIRADDGDTVTSLDRVLSMVDPTGTRMYQTNASVETFAWEEFELSTPWVLSSRSLVQEVADLNGDTNLIGTQFGPNGLQFYVASQGSGSILWFELSDNYKIGSSTFQAAFDLSADLPDPASLEGFFIRPDGSKMYVRDNDIHSFNLSTPYDVTTATATNKTYTPSSTGEGLSFGPNGDEMYIGGNAEVEQVTLTTAWDLENIDATKTAVMGLSGATQGLDIGDEGNKFYVAESGTIIEHNLNTPGEIDTFAQQNTISDAVHGFYIV